MEDDGKVVQTREGPKTLGEIRQGLRIANYDGPWDEASVTSAFNRSGPTGSTGTGTGTNMDAAAAADRALNTWLAYQRLIGVDMRRVDLEEARDVWRRAYEQAELSGYLPGQSFAGKGQSVLDAIGALRANAAYAAADGETRRQMEANTVAQTLGMDAAQARVAIDRLRAMTASTGQPSSAALVEQVLGQVPGTPTLARETEQNRTTVDMLRLMSSLRGPENAFAYASTLANIPESMKANIAAAMGRLPLTAQNAAQRGLFGDLGVGQPALPAAPAQPAAPAANAWLQTITSAYQARFGTPPPQSVVDDASNRMLRGEPIAAIANTWPSRTAQQATVPAAGATMEAAPTTFGPRTSPAVQAGLQRPSQWSPTSFNQLGTYGRKLMLAGYEHVGEDPEEVMDQYRRSLPTAVGPRHASYRAA